MTVKGGTSPACAACKYQRRKCISTCPLAPYFPANQPKMFQNVHRLFGVSNVTKLIDKLETKEEKDDAMTSIIYEAEMRERYPVHGCCNVIGYLRQQLHMATEELRHVKMQLDSCRQAEQSSDGWPPLPQFDDAFHKQEIVPYGIHVHDEFYNNGFFQENMVTSLLRFDHSNFHGRNSEKMHPINFEDSNSPEIHPSKFEGSNLDEIQEQMEGFGFEGKNVYPGQDLEKISQDNYRGQDLEKICQDNYSSREGSSLEDATQDPCERETRMGAEHGCRRELKTAAAGLSLTTVK